MYKSILLPVDLGESASGQKAQETAIKLAEQNGAELHVITVMPDFGMSLVGVYFEEGFLDKALKESGKKLQEYVASHIKTTASVKSHIAQGVIYDEILRAAEKNKCDLIVMASHRPALQDYLLGPNAARVMRHAKQSVFIVRD